MPTAPRAGDPDAAAEYLTIDQLSAHLQVPVWTLRHWRKRGYGPPVHKFGQALRYKVTDVEAWCAGQRDTLDDTVDRARIARRQRRAGA